MKPLSSAPDTYRPARTVFQRIWAHRELVVVSARRDVTQQYTGQVLGAKWAVFQPLFFVAVLAVVFNFVFKTRVAVLPEGVDYTVFILSGLVPWQVFLLLLARSGTEILSNANLVKQVVFPIETIPAKGVLTTVPTMGLGMLFLLVYQLVVNRSLPPTIALLPVVVVLQYIWMLGCSLLISSVAVFFRDLKDIVALLNMVSIYLLPIVYLPGSTPEPLRWVVKLNPFSALIHCYQDIWVYGRIEHPVSWILLIVFSVLTAGLGARVFSRVAPHMGNVL
jgi:lipopolysaccharide transport system permease protein